MLLLNSYYSMKRDAEVFWRKEKKKERNTNLLKTNFNPWLFGLFWENRENFKLAKRKTKQRQKLISAEAEGSNSLELIYYMLERFCELHKAEY